VRCVLAPRPDHERVAQDYFVYDLTLFHGLTLLRNDVFVHRYPELRQAPNLIVSHNPDHIADRKFIEAWRDYSPIVVHLHCQYRYFESKELRGPFSTFSNRENIDICLQHADIIIVPAGFLADDLRSLSVKLKPSAKVEVVSNGARQSLYYPSTFRQRTNFKANLPALTSSQPTLAQRQLPLDKKLIGFVGRLEDLKGRQLLEILVRENATNYRLADACLLLQFRYQPGNEEYDRCRRSAEALNQSGFRAAIR
jgi:glycosyltransferase involved in cell wall biosynthesis